MSEQNTTQPQPMETAPTRGTVLLWDADDGEWVLGVWTIGAGDKPGWSHMPGAWPVNATAWAPLPGEPANAR